jgi:hypothetical protein
MEVGSYQWINVHSESGSFGMTTNQKDSIS